MTRTKAYAIYNYNSSPDINNRLFNISNNGMTKEILQKRMDNLWVRIVII